LWNIRQISDTVSGPRQSSIHMSFGTLAWINPKRSLTNDLLK
jgi:hypothetical protein